MKSRLYALYCVVINLNFIIFIINKLYTNKRLSNENMSEAKKIVKFDGTVSDIVFGISLGEGNL